ncbi:unnamed protein product [Symbiodinium sp. CCMP2592]|nr:unnamed protein product [Symbiodinium sp. CCMP2592]
MAQGMFCGGTQKIVVFIPLVACLGLKLDVRTSDEPECKGKLVASKKLCSEVDPETKKKCGDRFVEVSAGQYMQCVWESSECLTASGLNEYCKKPSAPQPTKDGMFAWFKSEDASTSNWKSKVGNFKGFGTGNGMKIETEEGHGAKKKVKFLKGSNADIFDFDAILPKDYTICSVSRYTGGHKNRILQAGKPLNWLHGHWAGNTGVTYYQEWNTQSSRHHGSEDWVVLCGTNNKQVYDGRDPSKNIAGSVGKAFAQVEKLYVNRGHHEYSDFGVMEIITYKKQLTEKEIQATIEYLKWKLENGTPE